MGILDRLKFWEWGEPVKDTGAAIVDVAELTLRTAESIGKGAKWVKEHPKTSVAAVATSFVAVVGAKVALAEYIRGLSQEYIQFLKKL